MQSTINQMTEHFVLKTEYGDNAHHKGVRHRVSAPIRTTNDDEFTMHEVQAALEKV
jgi:hypothetical protein